MTPLPSSDSHDTHQKVVKAHQQRIYTMYTCAEISWCTPWPIVPISLRMTGGPPHALHCLSPHATPRMPRGRSYPAELLDRATDAGRGISCPTLQQSTLTMQRQRPRIAVHSRYPYFPYTATSSTHQSVDDRG
jgi:hypothetical protein